MQLGTPSSLVSGIGQGLQGGELEAPALSTGGDAAMSFKDRLTSFASEVNQLQISADKAASNMALGDVRSMHAVMIASEEASLALSTAIQLRNKATESYQEIMRMQV